MSLGKLFNFNYLKQNIKKSKGLITVLAFIVPVITALILIGNNSNNYATPTYQGEVVFPNVLGMYIIPVVLSFLLYGYVYKKNSVDFVGSMPLTRSTIFITNFIGGLIFILVVQILTAIVTALGATFLSKIFIDSQMILDNFIVMLLAYIFVFSATTLAMTVSGNFLTQVVVTMLIVFLIPFTVTFGLGGIERYVDIELANRQVAIEDFSLTAYTLPSIFFSEMLGNGNSSFFDAGRNVKTIAISIVYLAVGLYLFNKRKMENVGVSFSKTWVHLVVKGITLVPMVFILESLQIEGIFYWIVVTVIFIYYCLYDFITNRKVPVKLTIPCFIASFAILFGIYNGMQLAGTKLYQRSISVDDIQEIAVGTIDYSKMSSVSDWLAINRKMKMDISITDKDMINKICENIIDAKYRYTEDYSYSIDQAMVYIKIKTNNKEICTTASIEYETYKEVVDYVLSKPENLARYDEYNHIEKYDCVIANETFLSKEDAEELISLYNSIDIKQKLDTEREFTFYSGLNRKYIPSPSFTVYYYKDHDVRYLDINPFLSQELFDKMLEISQKRAREIFEKYDSLENSYLNCNIYDKIENQTAVDYNRYNAALKTEKGVLDYAKNHLNDKIDMNDTFYVCNIYSEYPWQATIYLKATEELEFILERDTYKDGEKYVDYNEFEDEIVYQ